ncbi:MAG TPA: GNAT family N-acetyltransferase [Pseudonocardiaceae bacterium]|nr:GNAT family N-acetyltransferase [Pseudonocardiaceae bacterium]
MDFKLRLGKPEDAETCARICYEAFASIARKHNFPPDILVEAAVGLISMLLGHPGFYSVVAESNGRIVGSNFLDERAPISGVGPITVDPAVQDGGVGRLLMQDVMRRATQRSAPGIRLVQSAYHNRSLSLYAKLGFQVREQLACMQGAVPQGDIPGYRTRRAMPPDAETCNALCRRIHGHDRAGELTDALGGGSALVVEHDGRISGYATGLAFFAHAVGESNEDIKALIMAADALEGPGILVPTTNADLFRWCLEQNLQVVQLMTLMTAGLYTLPQGAYLPSILY